MTAIVLRQLSVGVSAREAGQPDGVVPQSPSQGTFSRFLIMPAYNTRA